MVLKVLDYCANERELRVRCLTSKIIGSFLSDASLMMSYQSVSD